jgi:hypothetical protein
MPLPSLPIESQYRSLRSFLTRNFLLGRVYKHVSDYTKNNDFLNREAAQLHRTLQALANIADIED